MKHKPNFSRDAPFFCRLELYILSLIFLVHRIGLGPFLNLISDCDEVFNYWEPVHFISFSPFGSTRDDGPRPMDSLGQQLMDSRGFKLGSNILLNASMVNQVAKRSKLSFQVIDGNKPADHSAERKTVQTSHQDGRTYQTYDAETKNAMTPLADSVLSNSSDGSNRGPGLAEQQKSRQLSIHGDQRSMNTTSQNKSELPVPTSMQTWEYSPVYALRSYLYILVHSVFVWMSQFLRQPSLNKTFSFLIDKPLHVQVFFLTRCLLSSMAASIELQFTHSLKLVFGRRVATLYLLINLITPGSFLVSNQMLPSTSFMLISLLAFSNFLRLQFQRSLLWAVAGTVVCWPFGGIIYVTLGLLSLRRFGISMTLKTILQSAICILGLVMSVDYFYYGSVVISPLNIILYNTGFAQGGGGAGKSILFGVESWTFYIRNLLLNFNVFLLLGCVGLLVMSYDVFRAGDNVASLLPMVDTEKRGCARVTESTLLLGSPIVLWGGLMSFLPHKEERFLTPIYPLICFSAAVAIQWLIERRQRSSVHGLPFNQDPETGISKKHDDRTHENVASTTAAATNREYNVSHSVTFF